MFNLFKKKPLGQKAILKIKGMHCTSCAMNIDGALEDTDGVLSASTSYAKSQVEVVFDETKVSKEKLQKVIEDQGYSAV